MNIESSEKYVKRSSSYEKENLEDLEVSDKNLEEYDMQSGSNTSETDIPIEGVEDTQKTQERIKELKMELETTESIKVFSEVFEKLKSIESAPNLYEFWPKESLLVGGASIENQEIDLVRTPGGDINVDFKLTEGHREVVKKKLQDKASGFSSGGKFTYGSNSEGYHVSGSWEKDEEGFSLSVSSGTRGNTKVRSALGLVRIHIPKEKIDSLSSVEIGQYLDNLLKNEFEIENGLDFHYGTYRIEECFT
tara:strand:+ start:1536 stop:2282 length:747 start_codon:yes stop_codon:yes gene_type:complete